VRTGTGTAGAYHAGVLRALHEAGVRIDLVAGRGAGAIGAVFAAVDGGQRLWDKGGLWKSRALTRAYAWRRPLLVAGWAIVVAAALLGVPLVLLAAGVSALVAVLLSLVGLASASTAVTSGYARFVDAMFAPAPCRRSSRGDRVLSVDRARIAGGWRRGRAWRATARGAPRARRCGGCSGRRCRRVS
jgi:hypothetical protein